MRLEINGEVKRYYVQTLLMLFFPGEKYAEEDDGSGKRAVINVRIADGTAFCEADVCGVHGEGSCLLPSAEAAGEDYRREIRTEERAVKIAVGRAVFAAARTLSGRRPPWGILTGVRPSKLASAYLADGFSEEEVRRIFEEDYLLTGEKASLVTEVAIREKKILDAVPDGRCSVYLSIPFCPSRCAYCSFVSYSTPRLLKMIPDYLEKLQQDIVSIGEQTRQTGLRPYTVYIGGGTPTILSPTQLDSLMKTVNENLDLSDIAEFTVEGGRPDTITDEKLASIKAGGVTRLSVNTQTLNDDVLRAIGRKHTSADFYEAFNKARRSGIKYINTDLICGLECGGITESAESFARSFDLVAELRPDNITVHAFTVKKAAEAAAEGFESCSSGEKDAAEGVSYALSASRTAGYSPYYMYRQKNTVGNLENVGYCLPGSEGIYNILIMEETQTIFGAGAGSVTKLVRPGEGKNGSCGIERIFAPKYPYEYLAPPSKKDEK